MGRIQSGLEGTDGELASLSPPLRMLRQVSAQWLRRELRVRVKHLKGKGGRYDTPR
jgi:hypothetical protein